ncbi:putative metal-dependent enzyme of the double-stranded beta helix superfamily protein [Variovorax sp. PBL-E5]|nr:putative metal-dependent enzyme of the double-stranded beta helix superfamily protein [Variovorax sp. PBL-E5]
MPAMSDRLDPFVAAVTAAVERCADEAQLLDRLEHAMRQLVAADDWLPAERAQPHPQHYQQYLLHCDPQQRFSVVSFVWGPGQQTPIHDHTVWGVIGMLRGAEIGQHYRRTPRGMQAEGTPERLNPGDVAAVSPRIGDIHRVSNAFDDRVSVSIHVYGTDIGRLTRHVFDPQTGAVKDFVSGYANACKAAT